MRPSSIKAPDIRATQASIAFSTRTSIASNALTVNSSSFSEGSILGNDDNAVVNCKIPEKSITTLSDVDSRVDGGENELATWAWPYKLVLVLIQLGCCVPYVRYYLTLDSYYMLMGVSLHAITVFLTVVTLLLDPYPDEETREKVTKAVTTVTQSTAITEATAVKVAKKDKSNRPTYKFSLESLPSTLKKLPYVELISSSTPFLQILLDTLSDYQKGGRLSTSSCIYTVLYLLVIICLLRRRYRIKLLRIIGVRELENLVLGVIPKVVLSSISALSYLASESLGCLIHNSRNDAMQCYDTVTSNNTFSLVFVVLAFLRLWILPFAVTTYTPKNFVMFNFDLSIMLQFFTFLSGSIVGLFMFASSTQIDEIYWHTKDPLRRTLKFTSFMLLLTSISLSFVPQKLSQTKLASRFKSILATMYPFELAKFYRFLFVAGGVSIIAFIDVPLLNYCYRRNTYSTYGASNEYSLAYYYNAAKKYNAIGLSSWPLLMICVAGFFLSRPLGSGKKEKIFYCIVFLHAMALIAGKIIMKEYLGALKNCLVLPYFLLYFHYAVRIRKHLSTQSYIIIQNHLHDYFMKLVTTLPPLIFLFAEGIGCTMRYNMEQCESLIDSNHIVSQHLVSGLIFFIFFAFTIDSSITLKSIVTLRECSVRVIVMIVLVSMVSLSSFLVFGMRPDNNTASYIFVDMGNDEASALLKSYTKYLEVVLLCNAMLWVAVYFLQGSFVKALYMDDLMEGEERESRAVYVDWFCIKWEAFVENFNTYLLWGFGSSDDLRMGRLYRGALLMFMLLPSSLEAAFFVTGDLSYEWGASTHFELGLLSIVMFVFGDFSDAYTVCGIRVADCISCAVPSLNLLLGMLRKLVDDDLSVDPYNGPGQIIIITFAMSVVYRSKTLAADVLTVEEQIDVVQRLAFKHGFLHVFAPVLYVGAELSGCMLRNGFLRANEGEEFSPGSWKRLDSAIVAEHCGGLFAGSKAVTAQLVAMFYLSVSFAQIEDMSFGMKQVMRLELTWYQFLQISVFSLSCLLALILYGTRNDGKEEEWQSFLLSSFYMTWFLSLLLEHAKKVRGRIRRMTVFVKAKFRASSSLSSLRHSFSLSKSSSSDEVISPFSPMQKQSSEKKQAETHAGSKTVAGVGACPPSSVSFKSPIEMSNPSKPQPMSFENYQAEDDETPPLTPTSRPTLELAKSLRESTAGSSTSDKTGWRLLEFANKSHSSRLLASRPSFAERKRKSQTGFMNKAFSNVSSGSNLNGGGGIKEDGEENVDDALNDDPVTVFDPGFL